MASFYENNKRDIAEAQARSQSASQEDLNKAYENYKKGGYTIDMDALKRLSNIRLGQEIGKDQFSRDPDQIRLKKIREEQAKGYDSQELGAMRGLARDEMSGQRQKALQQLRSNLGRGGVGGARAAAIQNQADIGQQKAASETERKILLDSAGMRRQGVNDLQDFLFRQKLGEAGYGIGSAQLGSADEAARAAREANQNGGKK